MLTSCKHNLLVMEEDNREAFLTFVGHPRSEMKGVANPQLELHNWKEEGTLLLGGDIDILTSSSDEILTTYDTYFDLGSNSTLLTIGNHDDSNISLLLSYTGRERYYVHQSESTCIFVGDTQVSQGSITGDQLELFNTVVDTLSESSTFIYMTHKLSWVPGHPELEDQINSLPNGGEGTCNYCTQENNFYDVIYPKLVELKEKDIQVICLAGDLGSKTKNFEYLTNEGIQYLANGWKNDDPENNYLKFFVEEDQKLSWQQFNIE